MSEKRRTLAFVNSRFRKAEIASARGRLLFPVMIFLAVSLEPTCWAWPSGAAQSCTVLPSPAGPGGRTISTPPGPVNDRKSDVSGQSVSVRVDLGVRRIIKKKSKQLSADAAYIVLTTINNRTLNEQK